jgi:hypothetical protein
MKARGVCRVPSRPRKQGPITNRPFARGQGPRQGAELARKMPAERSISDHSRQRDPVLIDEHRFPADRGADGTSSTRGPDLEACRFSRLWRGFGDRVTLSDCVQGQAAGRTRLRAGGSVAGRLSFDHFDPGRGCPWQRRHCRAVPARRDGLGAGAVKITIWPRAACRRADATRPR